MTRAQIDKLIHIEQQRQGLLGLWLQETFGKNKRSLRLAVENKKKRHRR